jgi:hypothetical protein
MENVMQRTLVLVGLLSACLCGCGLDSQARQIVQNNNDPGRIWQSMVGSGEELRRSGQIDLHRRITVDGIEIDTWVMVGRAANSQSGQGQGTVVILHGLGESKASYPFLGIGRVLAKKGYDVVLPDLRAHGRSEGKYTTYGAKESRDVQAVVDALQADGIVDEPIYVLGATLGASTAIQYAAMDPEVNAVFAITPYRNIQTVAKRRLPLTSGEQRQAAIERAGEIADFSPSEADTVRAAADLDKPLLLVHGMFDLMIPAENSKLIHEAARGPKKLILIKPGPKQVALATTMEDWIARRMDELIRGGVDAVD